MFRIRGFRCGGSDCRGGVPFARFGDRTSASWLELRRTKTVGTVALCLDPQDPGGIVAENSGLLFISEGVGARDVVGGVEFPDIRVVANEHDLAGADLIVDGGAFQPLLLHCGLKLLRGKLRVLQCKGREGSETIGPGGNEFGEFFVLDTDDSSADIGNLLLPERIDRQTLHIDRLAVHRLHALFDDQKGFRFVVDRRDQSFGAFFAICALASSNRQCE